MCLWEVGDSRHPVDSQDARKLSQTPQLSKNLCYSNSSNIQLGVCWIFQMLCILEDLTQVLHHFWRSEQHRKEYNCLCNPCASINYSVFNSFFLLGEKSWVVNTILKWNKRTRHYTQTTTHKKTKYDIIFSLSIVVGIKHAVDLTNSHRRKQLPQS